MPVPATLVRMTGNEALEDGMSTLEKATFGGGCFWCLEAVFQRLDGVHSVVSGYAGGHEKNPTYYQVCRETTGHAEVVQIEFDSSVVSYDTLLEWFFRAHDPTTLNRQGADVGTQYRSIILTHDDAQKHAATQIMARLETEKRFNDPIVTQVESLDHFYKAEISHQDYYNNHKQASYCQFVIQPKLEKLKLDH